jgi:ParB/RepB/Spo0J family partition protein
MEPTTIIPITAEPRLVRIEEIYIRPGQPRETQDEQQFNELVASIRVKNILQSLLLKPREEGGYYLICGHRRLEAAKTVGLKEVPAIIRDILDDEIREVQVIENLQRENVHPMEQAKAFLGLATDSQMSPEDISNRVGKPVYFVRQQLKLNRLTEKWKAIFRKNGISVTTALQICVLPESAQNELYNTQVNKEDEKSDRPRININSYLLGRYSGDLKVACFDINDPELDKKRGACTSCPFNSALYSIFQKDEQQPKCNDVVCFKNKTTLHIHNELTKSKEDPNILIVYEDYHIPEIAKALKEEGIDVYRVGYGEECQLIRKPVNPVWEDYQRQGKLLKQSDKAIKNQFKKDQETFSFENEVFEERLATGRYKKAFVVHSNSGHGAGKYVYVELTAKKTAKNAKKAIDDGNATIEDIDNEIVRLEKLRIRTKELGQENVHENIVETIKKDGNINVIPKKVNATDNLLIAFLILEHIGESKKQEIQKVIKSPALWNPKNIQQCKKAFSTLNKFQMAYLVRKIMVDKYSSFLPNTKQGYMYRLMAESLGTVPIADYENIQKEIVNKKQQKQTDKISELKKLKKEIANKPKAPISNVRTANKEKVLPA